MLPGIQRLIEETGFYVAHNNPQATERELEFLIEQIIKVCQKANQRQAFELMGAISDIEQGNGFDEVCLSTVKRVKDYLYNDSLEQLFLDPQQ